MTESRVEQNWFIVAWIVGVAAPIACLIMAIVPDGDACGPESGINVADAYIDMININRFSFDIFVAIYVVLGRCWLLLEIGAVATTPLHWLLPSCIATIVADFAITMFRFGGEIICHRDNNLGRPPVGIGAACASRSDLLIVQITILFATLAVLLGAAIGTKKSNGTSPW